MFGKMKKIQYMMMAVAAMMVLTACEKVSPIGVLVSGTGVEDRVKMSHLYYQEQSKIKTNILSWWVPTVT